MKSACTVLLTIGCFLVLVAAAAAQAAAVPPAPAGAAVQPGLATPAPAVPAFDLEAERRKAAGTFLDTKDGRKRRDPFRSPLRTAAETPVKDVLAREVQAQLVSEAEVALGLYQAALNRKQLTSANVHLNRLLEILGQSDKFSIPEFRERLEQVRAQLDVGTILADSKFREIKAAFEAGDYDRVGVLYEELTNFVGSLPKGEKEKLAARMAEVKEIVRRAQARLAFVKIPISITGVVLGGQESYATINGLVLGVGDLVRNEPDKGGPVSPLNMPEPLEPQVKVAEIQLTEIVFEYEGERLSRKVGRRYLIQERARRSPGAHSR